MIQMKPMHKATQPHSDWYASSLYYNAFGVISEDLLENSYSNVFEPLYLPRGPDLADHVWTFTIRIIDTRWSTTVVYVRAKVGELASIVTSPRVIVSGSVNSMTSLCAKVGESGNSVMYLRVPK